MARIISPRLAWLLTVLLCLNLILWPTGAVQARSDYTSPGEASTNSAQFINQDNPLGLSEKMHGFTRHLDWLSGATPAVVIGSDGSLTITGSLDGAKFLLKLPRQWNHKFVFFAHGYTNPGTPNGLELPALDEATKGILDTAFGQGYAYGYSAYGKMGYAVENGINSIQTLKKLTDFLNVKRDYIVGESMGGNITMGLIEKYKENYDGALSYCGVVAGWDQEIRYLTDFRVVYDYFTAPLGAPFKLPNAGQAATYDPNFSADPIYNSLSYLFGGAAAGNPTLANIIGQIANVTKANPDFVSFATALLSSNGPVLLDNLQTSGGQGYSNIGKNYTGSANDAALNAGVERIAAVDSAAAYLNNWYAPKGNFTSKVLSVHNLVDPLVPYEFESILKTRVAGQGNSGHLVQQVVDPRAVTADPSTSGPTHCYFNNSQFKFAWNELRNWVEQGVKLPEGLNITTR
jgi:pimeloyl-ACP methyl ester carboxylesterase